MSSKTRKLIWSVPLMATLAVVGALAVFVALGLPTANPAEAAPPAEGPEARDCNGFTWPHDMLRVNLVSPDDGGSPIYRCTPSYKVDWLKADRYCHGAAGRHARYTFRAVQWL